MKVAYHATARVVGRVPASVFVPRPAVESVLVRIDRRPDVAVDPIMVPASRLFELVRAGFGHRRKMLRQSLAGVVAPDAFRAAGIDPEARAETLGIEEWGRLAAHCPRTPGMTQAGEVPLGVTIEAPAKLTLSLRVTGVRDDGFHLLDAEMVSIDLADTLTFEPGWGISVHDEVCGGLGVRSVPLGPENLVASALRRGGPKAAVRIVKRIPSGAGLGGGSADAGAVLRWARCDDVVLAVGLGADVPFCVRGGRARVTGVGEIVEPLPFEDRCFVLLAPPLSSTPARSTDSGTTVVPDGPGPERPTTRRWATISESAAIDVAPALARWRERLGEVTGVRPRLAGSGSSWFVEGDRIGLGLAGRDFLAVEGERAPLLEVRTVRALTVR